MNTNIGRSCLSLVLLSALVELTRCNENETNGTDIRRGRVNGRIVKLYSGYKPEPVLCLNEGFQADPVDCSVFYRCAKSSSKKYTIFKFQCGPGTVYDPETEVCNHPRNTKRSECGGLVPSENINDENEIEGHELPSPISTIRPVYISPLETNNVTTFTSPSHIEPANFNYLDYKTSTSTPLPVITTTKREVSEISNSLQAYPWTDSRNKTFGMLTTSVPDISKGFPCTSDGFIGDKDDCRKFHRCISNSRGGFTRYEFSCSESTIWDDNIQSCNHAWAARNILCGKINLNSNKEKNTLEKLNNLLPHTEQPLHYGQRVTQNQNYNYNEIDKDNKFNYHNKINTESKIDENDSLAYKPPNQLQNKVSDINERPVEYPSFVKEHNKYHTEIISSTETIRHNETLFTNYPVRNLECSQTGFMGDPNDCAKFYRCVDNGKGGYTKFEFSCGQGTVWDSKVEACNHAWAVKECGGMSPMKNEPTTNIPAQYQTSTTTPTNPTIRTTISTNYTDQISAGSTINEDNDSGYVRPVNQEFEKITSSTTVTTISLLATTTAPATILTNCRESGFFANEDDCQKFYRCVDNGNGSFTKYQYECGEGTLWDPNIGTCNHATDVKSCNTSFTTTVKYSSVANDNKITTTHMPIHSTISEHSENNENDSGYNVPLNPVTIASDMDISITTQGRPLTQRKECQSTGFIGDPNDCKKFYRCVDNGIGGYTQYEFSCGEGTVWDSEIEACNHAWAVKECGGNKDTNEITTTSSTTTSDNLNELNNGYPTQNHDNNVTHANSEPSNIDTSTTKHTSTTTSSIKDNNNNCQATGFFGDRNDCKKFYRCVDDGKGGFTKFEFSCGEGTVWDSTSEICNHEWAVEKCGGNNKNELTSTTAHSVQSTTELQSISSTKMQTTSTLAVSKITTHTHQPSTPIYSASSSIYTEGPAYNKENKCVSDGFFANPHNCKKFYRCVDDGKGGYTKFEFDCGEGTVWVQESQVCDHETDVTKCSYSSSTSTESYKETPAVATASATPAINNEQVSESEQTDATTKTSTTLSTTVKPKPDTSDQNICHEDGYFGDTKNCKKFYRCVNNGKGGYTKYDFTCGEGTIWDQDISACNHPEDVTNVSCSSEKENVSTTTSSSTQYVSTDKSTASTSPEKSTTSLTSTERISTSSNEVTSESTSTLSTTTASSSNNNDTNVNCDSNNSTKQSQNETIKCEKAGFYPNPSDCKKFYRCVDWDSNAQNYSIYHFECGEGTIWDPALETCNHEDSVYPPRNCNGTQQQNENVTEAVTTTSTTQQSSTQKTTPQTTQQTTTLKSTTQLITDSTSTQEPSSSSSTEQTTSSSTEQTTSSSTEQSTEQTTSSSTEQTTSSSTEQTTSSSTEQTTSSNTEQTTSSSTEQTTSSSTEQTTSASTEQSTEVTSSSSTEQTTPSSTEQTTSSSTDPSTSSSTEQSTSSSTELSTEQTTSSNIEQTTSSSTEQTTTSSTEQTTSSSTEQSTSSSTEQSTSSSTEQSTSSSTEQTTSSSTEKTTTEQSTSTESTTTQVTEAENTTPTTSNQECPQTDGDQSLFVCPTSFRRHPKYCNLFYQCTEDNNSHEVKVAVFNCPNNTIYDEKKVQCVEEDKADKKCNGQMAQRHRVKRLEATFSEPIIVTKESLACRTAGHFPFEKHEECSGALLKCQHTKSGKLRGYVYKCPEGFVYWSVSRRCEAMKKVQDCKMKPYAWNKRYDLPVETSNIAT